MNPGNEPTEKQLAVIRRLAKQTNTAVDFSGIGSRRGASKLIDELIAKKGGKVKEDSNGYRDKKCIYGLSVKLIFQKSIQLNMDYKADQFWNEVEEFYRQYVKHQDRATKSGSQR
ncbi:hypothetical protein GF312_04350 [Candidatus Poribacteria bacterium]|nr:hypothetical protein [Candidatus Poribacteria bacterium]